MLVRIVRIRPLWFILPSTLHVCSCLLFRLEHLHDAVSAVAGPHVYQDAVTIQDARVELDTVLAIVTPEADSTTQHPLLQSFSTGTRRYGR